MALVRKPKETITVNSKDITWIKDILTELSGKVEAIDKTTTKLNSTIVGDSVYGQVGLVDKVKKHEEYIEAHKHFKSKIIGGGIVLSLVWTFILKFWERIF